MATLRLVTPGDQRRLLVKSRDIWMLHESDSTRPTVLSLDATGIGARFERSRRSGVQARSPQSLRTQVVEVGAARWKSEGNCVRHSG